MISDAAVILHPTAQVQSSDVFLLVLTQSVLTRWYCQQEILAAIEAGKPIQILIEEEERFFAFNTTVEWLREPVSSSALESNGIPAAIQEVVRKELPHAIGYVLSVVQCIWVKSSELSCV